jgi:hypothetical protein
MDALGLTIDANNVVEISMGEARHLNDVQTARYAPNVARRSRNPSGNTARLHADQDLARRIRLSSLGSASYVNDNIQSKVGDLRAVLNVQNASNAASS